MDNTLITNDRLETFKRNAQLIPPGLIAEVGVYRGGSLKYLAELFPDRQVWGFDTFEGLPPEHWNKDERHNPGEFSDTSIEAVRDFVNSKNVHLIKGLFPWSIESTGGIENIALAHIDTDFYLSVKACIEWFAPRMVKGGMIVFDDYGWGNCPGVKKALDESGLKFCVSANFQALVVI
jgi:hypothetical protein